MMHPTPGFYFSQRLKLHYLDWGNTDAPPLILIHGGMDHCRNWDWVVQHLQPRYHVIAPDLRGHGDSQWADAGNYDLMDFVYDIHQLITQKNLPPVTIISHSLGGAVALHYAGLYPEKVERLIAIEGLGPSPKMLQEREQKAYATHVREWFDRLHQTSGRSAKRYPSIADATARMQAANPHLTLDQAKHLTIHGILQNEDGSFSWKFDNYLHVFPPFGIPMHNLHELWASIECPTLLIRGENSWASNPAIDGRAKHFKNAQVVNISDAGHWVHHDQLAEFINTITPFLEN